MEQPYPLTGRRQLFSRFWRSGGRFWRGRRPWSAWGLAVSLAAVAILQLVVPYRLNLWNRDFFNALEHRDGGAPWPIAFRFLLLAASSTALGALALRGRVRLQRLWREAMSIRMASYWFLVCRYEHLDDTATENKNPEYRLTDDARTATDAPIDLAFGFLSSALAASTFIGVLSNIGGALAVTAFGVRLAIPNYLVAGVILYSIIVTGTMLLVGRALPYVIANMSQSEAELRAAATLLREVGEHTAQRGIHPNERRMFWVALRRVTLRWSDLASQLMCTSSVSQANILLAPVAAWLLCAPKYISGAISLGELTQAAAAFVIVQGAFNWLVDNYQRVADWRSAVNRIGTFLVALDDLRCATPVCRVEPDLDRAETT
jgi:vitamin B12/bleomycin/antimicrobial peptide transport system ATP-binding/permease protein